MINAPHTKAQISKSAPPADAVPASQSPTLDKMSSATSTNKAQRPRRPMRLRVALAALVGVEMIILSPLNTFGHSAMMTAMCAIMIPISIACFIGTFE